MISGGDIKTLGATVKEYRELRVADYQRNYNWETEHITDLWNDILECTSEDGSHFFGSLILEKKFQNSGRPEAEVVDGQQRLTTLMIFVSRLRDELVRLGGDRITRNGYSFSLLDDLHEFIGQHPNGTKFIPNLLIRGEFSKALLNPKFNLEEDKSEGRQILKRSREDSAGATLPFRNSFHLVRNYILADLNHVAKGIAEDKVSEVKQNRIYDLWLTITEKFKVLTITTTSQVESLEVFLTTNDRGLDLGVMDLVRGKILSVTTRNASSEEDRKATFETQMNDLALISKQVGTAKQIDQFVRQWLHLRPETELDKDGRKTYKRLTMKKVPEFVEELIRDAEDQQSGAQAKAAELWQDIKYGASVYPRTLGEVSDGISSVTRLRLMALKSAIKSYRILAFRICDKKIGLTKDQVEDLIRYLLRAVLSFTLSGGNAQDLETELQKIAHNLRTSSDFLRTVNALEEIRKSRELEKQHIDRAASDKSYARAFLFALAAESSGQAGIIEKYDVEHIAPQTSTDHWRKTLGLKGSAYSEVVSSLGNLTLLDNELNNEVKQKPFSEKTLTYRTSNVAMAREINIRFGSWGLPEIEARTEDLVTRLFSLLTN